MGALHEDERLLLDKPLNEVMAHAAARAQRAELETFPGDLPEEERPTLPSPPPPLRDTER
jgi:hypothetical protein